MRVRRGRRRAPSSEDAVPAADAPDPDAELLAERQARIEHELTEAVGGASLCAISRSVGSVPAAKYLEGRRAVVTELRRAVRRGAVADEVRRQLASEWRQALADVTDSGAGPDWKAYRAGGVDELDELVAMLGGGRGDGPDTAQGP